MSINIESEKLLSFRQAAKLCPRRRRGRKPAISTFYRWKEQGLETIRVGGQLCTSLQALQRFFDRLTSPTEAGSDSARPVSAHSAKESRHQARVERELVSFGL